MADVTIRGAGIFGLSIAWTCARRGARVRVIDPFGPGAGASGGLVGALAPHVPENWNAKKAFQFESLLMAAPFWADVEATGGVNPLFRRAGRLQPIADDAALALARTRETSAAELWQGKAEWKVIPVGSAGRWAPPSASGHLIRDTLSAHIHPRRAIAALQAALAVLGVDILPEAPDRGRVVLATGVAGLTDLSETLGKPLGGGVKGQAALLRFDAGNVPQIFANTLHFIPHADGTLAIGSTSEREWDDPDGTDTRLDDLIARAADTMPVLHGAEVIERWAGLRPRARSRAPMLGPHPKHPDRFIANGGFKIGFGIAPKVAETIADLVLDDRDTIPDAFHIDASL